ncbi:MAG TPA: hypothetical protein VHI11_02380 [Jiangellaceae bacterium]|jgi:hypothetical protein|nr:hypothetical protein [Jiangellaceae bacterium]
MIHNRSLRALSVAVLVVALAGCLRVDMALEITENDTIDGEVILATSDELVELSGQDPEELVEQLEADVVSDAPEGVTQEPYQAEGFQGTRLILDDVALDEFNPSDEETLSIRHEGDEYVVTGVLDASGADEFGQLTPDDQQLLEDFADSMDVRLAITFPGDVIEQRNGEVDGRTVTWSPEFGETVEVQARAEDGSGGSSVLWLIVAMLAALVIIGVIILLALRRRPQAEPTGDTPTVHELPSAAEHPAESPGAAPQPPPAQPPR